MEKLKLAFVIILSFLFLGCDQKPVKEDMVHFFGKNKALFTDLSYTSCKEMTENSLKSYIYPSASPDLIVIDKLDENLKNFLDSTSLQYVAISNAPCRIYASAWAVGSFGEGQTLGFEYKPTKVNEYLGNFDEIEHKGDITKHVPLENGWYITYTYTP